VPEPRPTLDQLIAGAAGDLSISLPGADGLLRFSNLGVLVRVLAAMVNGSYGYLDWIARQCTPFTATDEYLEAWAALKDVVRHAPTAASGPVQFIGVDGAPLPVGTPVVRSDGRQYETQADEVVAGGVVSATIVDVTPYSALTNYVGGSAGNAQSGVQFTLGTAVPNIQSGGGATGPITGGTDAQTNDSLRTDMLEAYSAQPQGGDLLDYVTWSLQVPGVTRAWNAGVGPGGAGTVTLYFMMDEAEAAFGGFPQGTDGVATNETRSGAPAAATGDQLAVANHIYPLRPVTALVIVDAPVANPVAMTISETAGWSTATQDAVTAAVAQVFFESAAPGGVTDASGDPVGVVDLSNIEAAIAEIAGTAGFVITAVSCPDGTITPGGDGNIASNTGYLATPGVITFA
jgi:uncharacterized phage protein gp47/JayE